MDRRGRFSAALVAIGVALALVPAAAPAKSGFVVQPRRLTLEFEAKASAGYDLSVEASDTGKVALTLFGGDYLVTYTTTGQVTPTGIQADFGRVGRIDVGFSGKPVARAESPLPHRHCKGPDPLVETGRFTGTIHFRGEREYAEFDADRVAGTLRQQFRRTCTRGIVLPHHRAATRGSEDDEGVTDLLTAAADLGRRHVLLTTVSDEVEPEDDGPSVALILVKLDERAGPVQISRDFLSFPRHYRPAVSTLGTVPVTASVKPPPPFSGTATYSREPGADPQWRGSLGIELPGAGRVALTGPRFEAVLCQEESSRAHSPCRRRARALWR